MAFPGSNLLLYGRRVFNVKFSAALYTSVMKNLLYSAVGIFFGIVLVKAEVISWFRIQEMFRLKSFHMYGVIGTAVLVGAISVHIIKTYAVKTIGVENLSFQDKELTKGQVKAGLLFRFELAVNCAFTVS